MKCPVAVTLPSWRAWLLAARPSTLALSVAPVIVGSAAAHVGNGFHLPAALAALAVAVLLQVLANLANDLFDYQRGADTSDRIGPLRVTQAGLISPRAMEVGMAVILALIAICGLYLAWRGGWPVLLAGLLAAFAALAYSGGRVAYGYRALGDLAVFVFFGPVAVVGTHWTQTLTWSWTALALSLPIGLLATAVLALNNLRDLETDRRAGKITLAVKLGPGGARAYYLSLLALAAVIPPGLALAGHLPGGVAFAGLVPVAAVPIARRVLRRSDGPGLNAALAATARLTLVFAMVLAAGILL